MGFAKAAVRVVLTLVLKHFVCRLPRNNHCTDAELSDVDPAQIKKWQVGKEGLCNEPKAVRASRTLSQLSTATANSFPQKHLLPA